ncbi:MAG: sigma-70 family RNA polymerase sigma factor [Candidatus Coatesbacteria bacterium]
MTPPGVDEDAALVRQAKAGDYAAFEALMAKYERRMYGLTVGILQQREDAEDAVQRTFLSVVEHLKGFREEAAFRTWLTRIATNHALEILRKRRGLPTVPFEESPSADDEAGPPFPEFVAGWRENPERLATRAETAALMDKALAELDEKHRAVFLLRDVQGFSVAETSSALGITEGNVKVRLLRARLKLRERLTRDFGDPATRVDLGHPHGP